MNTHDKAVIKTYFSDYARWLLCVSVLFAVSFAVDLFLAGMSSFFWVIPVGFLMIYSISIPLLVLYVRVQKDLKECNIEKRRISVKEIKEDRRFTFQNRGGAAVGRSKYRILDEDDQEYLISAFSDKDCFMGFSPAPDFEIEAEYLKRSRMVLRMNLMEGPQTRREARRQKNNMEHFRKTFRQYF